MSSPFWSHDDVLAFHSYTRTCPALLPFPLLSGAPIATTVPSDDNDTEVPDSSRAASPMMSDPNWSLCVAAKTSIVPALSDATTDVSATTRPVDLRTL